DRRGGRRVALAAHRAAQRLTGRRGEDAPLPERIVVAVGDAPGVCHMNVGGPEMAPHTPQRSSRPGGPGTRLDTPQRSSRLGGPGTRLDTPQRSSRLGGPVTRLDFARTFVIAPSIRGWPLGALLRARRAAAS